MRTQKLDIFKIITLAIVLTTGLSFVYASWTAQGATPPNEESPDTFITTGRSTQTKTGLFTVAGGIKVGSPNVGPGGCITTLKGTLRFSVRLEVCDGAMWVPLNLPDQRCDISQNTPQACLIYDYEACNCSKDGCGECEVTSPGTQESVKYSCRNFKDNTNQVDINSEWSDCQ